MQLKVMCFIGFRIQDIYEREWDWKRMRGARKKALKINRGQLDFNLVVSCVWFLLRTYVTLIYVTYLYHIKILFKMIESLSFRLMIINTIKIITRKI